jgi:acetoacetyl-CoA reductase
MSSKVALVTGGTGGIGTAICRELAAAGNTVAANYYPGEDEQAQAWLADIKKDFENCHVMAADVSDYDSSVNMIQRIESEIGPIDILVNCAGITRDKTLKRMTPDQWNAVIDTNLNSAFNVTQPVIGGMAERGFGRVVNISSVNGQKGQFGQANYSAAKAGLHGFTMAVAQETATKGVTVNTVSPGYVETAMTKAMPEEVLQAIVGSIPMGRMGQPEDIAATVGFLAQESNGYITGANIPVNGGLFISA